MIANMLMERLRERQQDLAVVVGREKQYQYLLDIILHEEERVRRKEEKARLEAERKQREEQERRKREKQERKQREAEEKKETVASANSDAAEITIDAENTNSDNSNSNANSADDVDDENKAPTVTDDSNEAVRGPVSAPPHAGTSAVNMTMNQSNAGDATDIAIGISEQEGERDGEGEGFSVFELDAEIEAVLTQEDRKLSKQELEDIVSACTERV